MWSSRVIPGKTGGLEEMPSRYGRLRTSRITADLLEAAAQLQVVGEHGVGVGRHGVWMQARARGIAVISTPGANANAVAELGGRHGAVGCPGRISLLDRMLREGSLSGSPPQGFELTGRTVGVVGMGSVGRRTAALFRNAFGAPLLAFSTPSPRTAPSPRSGRSGTPAWMPCCSKSIC